MNHSTIRINVKLAKIKLIQVKKDSAKFQLQRTNEIFFQQTDNLRSGVRFNSFWVTTELK